MSALRAKLNSSSEQFDRREQEMNAKYVSATKMIFLADTLLYSELLLLGSERDLFITDYKLSKYDNCNESELSGLR